MHIIHGTQVTLLSAYAAIVYFWRGIPPVSPALWEDSLPLEPLGKSAPLTVHFNSFFVISILLKTESGPIFFLIKKLHNRKTSSA